MRRALATVILLCYALIVGGASTAAAEPPWSWPLAPPHAIARQFIAPATPYAAGHRGIDIRAADVTVFAPANGTVYFVGTVVDRPVVSLAHGDGVLSSFEPVQSALSVGDIVRRGDVIGTLVPGHCTEPCLHFGVRLDGQYVNPLLYVGTLERSVLLPTRRLD
jgi:murein DD-endopeptidase MepM/ murein hydrolase activator NlpD